MDTKIELEALLTIRTGYIEDNRCAADRGGSPRYGIEYFEELAGQIRALTTQSDYADKNRDTYSLSRHGLDERELSAFRCFLIGELIEHADPVIFELACRHARKSLDAETANKRANTIRAAPEPKEPEFVQHVDLIPEGPEPGELLA